jgi:hypothetical protein
MSIRTLALMALLVLASPVAAQMHDHDQQSPGHSNESGLSTPAAIAAGHVELHNVLSRATKEPEQLGVAARGLEAVLAPHFAREEEIAAPPLSLLPALARGDVTPDMAKVLPLTDALERELPHMLLEHDGIRQATLKFRAAAVAAGQADYVRFSDNLAAHAREEEDILYPAAILVGRYVRRGLANSHSH